MRYLKPPLSFDQQANLLIYRGLQDVTISELIEFLQNVNYYRLSGYLYTFKKYDHNTGEEKFANGTSFIIVKQRYEFDRRLRLLLMDAIERIEVSIFRTRLVEIHTTKYGPFGYTDPANYDYIFANSLGFSKLLSEIEDDISRSHEEFVARYKAKYVEEPCLPFWMTAELMSFGQMFTLYKNLEYGLKRQISSYFHIHPVVMDSWLHSLNYIRNACAHHVRLWNRLLPLPPKIPYSKNNPEWHIPVEVDNKRVFVILTICQYLLKELGLNGQWKSSVDILLGESPNVPIHMMGFPPNWEDSPIWK